MDAADKVVSVLQTWLSSLGVAVVIRTGVTLDKVGVVCQKGKKTPVTVELLK